MLFNYTEMLMLCLFVSFFFSHTQVYSCSADGFVIVWDVLTLKVKKQFHLDCEGLKFIQLHNGMLWCGKSAHAKSLRHLKNI